MRVFYDRLVDDTDRTWFLDVLSTVMETHFSVSLHKALRHLLPADSDARVDVEHVRHVIFGDVMTAVGGTDEEEQAAAPPAVYDEIPDTQ